MNINIKNYYLLEKEMMSANAATRMFKTAIVGVLIATATVFADRRSYVWTYEYQTMPQGKSELEYYLTTKVPDMHKYSDENVWEQQVELEYGITDHWDVAIYQRWEQFNSSSEDNFEYTGSKLRTRYRLGERGMFPLDTLLYLEYIKPDNSHEAGELEGKLVLARDFGKFNLAYNEIIETGLDSDGDTVHEYATGLSYEFSPQWKAGVESTGSWTDDEYSVGPTVSYGAKAFWVNLGLQRGLNERTDDMKVRLIVGIPF